MLLLLSIVKRNSKASGAYGMGETTTPYAQREVHRQSATRPIYEVHKKTEKKQWKQEYTIPTS